MQRPPDASHTTYLAGGHGSDPTGSDVMEAKTPAVEQWSNWQCSNSSCEWKQPACSAAAPHAAERSSSVSTPPARFMAHQAGPAQQLPPRLKAADRQGPSSAGASAVCHASSLLLPLPFPPTPPPNSSPY